MNGRLRSWMVLAERAFATYVATNETAGDGYIVVSLEETKRAMRLMAEMARIISEGAGALPLAAALTGKLARDRSLRSYPWQHRSEEILRPY